MRAEDSTGPSTGMVRAGVPKQSPASGLLELLTREGGDTGNYCSNIVQGKDVWQYPARFSVMLFLP